MTTQITLAKLVRTSLARRVNKRVFVSLLSQLLDRAPAPDNELVEALLDLDCPVNEPRDADARALRLHYSVEYALSSADSLARFFRLLAGLSTPSQRLYVTYVKNHPHIVAENLAKDALPCLAGYTGAVAAAAAAGGSSEQRNLWLNLVFLWAHLIQNHAPVRAAPATKDLSVVVIKTLDKMGETKALAFFRARAASISVASQAEKPAVKQEPVVSSLSIAHFNGTRYPSYLRLKKFLWLRARFRSWSFSALLADYLGAFGHARTLAAPAVEDALHSFFGGLLLAAVSKESAYVLFNWKNYIVSQLPSAIASLARSSVEPDITQAMVATVKYYSMQTITQMNIGGASARYDLGKEFLRSCIYKSIVSLAQYTAAYPEDAESLSSSLITHEIEQLDHVDGLASEYRSKLAAVNTEFTSLGESRLIEFFQQLSTTNLRFSRAKQKRLTEQTNDLVRKLIGEKNNEKLSRLFLAFSNSLSATNYIFFNDPKGPWTILSLVIGYIDGEQFNMDGDDASFQDTYSYFGTILSGVIAVSSFFGVDFSSIDIKESYTANYINRFFYRSCDDLTSKIGSENSDDVTIAANYDKLFTDWANALFDVNNDGLSDELIRSVNVKQIYKFIFLLFREAIQARATGSLTESSLNNGIDYLSQNFLIPCSLEIIQWLTMNIGPTNSHTNVMMQVLLRIIEANIEDKTQDGAGEPNYTFRMILNAVGPKLMQRLQSLPTKNESFARLVAIMKREVDVEYCTSQILSPQALDGKGAEMRSRERLLAVSKDDIFSSAESKASMWIKFQCDWRMYTHSDITICLLQEVDRLHKAQSQTQLEEARMSLDFLMNFLLITSEGTKENFEWCCKKLTAGAPADSPDSTAKISLTMDDHFSAIFNEIGPAANEPQVKNEPGNFDDLFNDMGEDLFSDSIQASAYSIPAFEKESRAVSIEKTYKDLVFRISPLVQAVTHLASMASTDEIVKATKAKLVQDLKKEIIKWA